MANEVTFGWVAIELVADKTGKIIDQKKYWAQPDF
jgi:hypothetical protein